MSEERKTPLGGSDRSHYFTGKLMTVGDFELEQSYLNDRRRLGNRLLHGMGVVSGLNVLAVDAQTISLEPGVALDALGREIVVPEPCAKRLSALEGFDACGDAAYLCLHYREEPREETFSAAGAATGSLERAYNRIHEGYALTLLPQAPAGAEGLAALWRQELTLWEGDGLRLAVVLPRFAVPGGLLRGAVRLEKRGLPAPAHYKLTLTGDLFEPCEVCFDETEVGAAQTDERPFSLRCTAHAPALAALRAERVSLRCGQVEEAPPDGEAGVELTAQGTARAVAERYYSAGPALFDPDVPLCLARLHLVSDGPVRLIERLEVNPFGQYAASAALLELLRGLPGEGEPETGGAVVPAEAPPPAETPPPPALAGGVETVHLGPGARAGRDYFSDEFVHGLGYGRVAVVAALENAPAPLSGEEELLFFGDGSIFQGDKFPHTLPKVRVGALVSPGRGTLRLGVHLMEKTDQQALSVRWWAFRAGEEAPEQAAPGGMKVRVTPNTVSLEPLGQVRLSASVEGDADQEVRWSVVSPEGGEVDQNGVYLAPAGEGVFEVSARSVKHEDKSASAYIVVHEGPEEG